VKNIKSFQEYNDQLNEGFLSKSFIAGLLMSIGSLYAQEKDEFIRKADSINATDLTTAKKSAAINLMKSSVIQKIKEEARKKEALIKSRTDLDSAQKNSEIQKIRAQEREDIKIVNTKWVSAEKVYMKEKIDTWLINNPGKTEKDYWKEQEKLAKQNYIPLDGLQDPSFKSTKCGISKAGAKDAKKEWSKK
jgi:hypothetical protein